MKHRIAALTAVAAVGVAAAAPSQAQTPTALPKLATVLTKSAEITTTRTAVTFRTTGKVTYSNKTRFPPGTTDPAYGVKAPTKAQACKGTVRVTEYRGRKLIVRKNVAVKPDCSYATTTTISRRLIYGQSFVRARFLGNSVLAADNAPATSIRLARRR